MQKHQNTENGQYESSGKDKGEKGKTLLVTLIAFAVGVAGIALIGWAVACWIPLGKRGEVFAQSALSFAILIAVAVQVYVYFRQADIAGDALIIGNRSLVSVGIESNMIQTGVVKIYLENVGRVPAFEIDIAVEILALP